MSSKEKRDQMLSMIADWQQSGMSKKQYCDSRGINEAKFYYWFSRSREQDGSVQTRAVYNILGVNRDGRKDLIGIYLSENEGAKFWLSVLTDLKQRGVEDILVACVDGLKGFPDTIESVYPKTQVQLCIVHQIRSSLRVSALRTTGQLIS